MARTRRSIPWAIVGLVALALATAALVVLALRPPEPPPPTVTVEPSAPALPTAEPDGSAPTATEESREESSEAPENPFDLSAPAANPTGRELPLDVLSARSAVRGVPGACPGGGAQLEVSDDGGVTWREASTPVDLLLRAARPEDRGLWMVGALGPDCAPGFVTSADAGASWVGPSVTTGAWHLLPDPAATSLHAPYAEVPSPCDERRTLEVEPASFSQASVLCGDGEVFATADAGVTWTSAGTTPGAIALGLSGDRPVVAVPSDGDCNGLAIGSPGDQPLGCVSDAPSDAVALSYADEASGWVVAGGSTWTTTDGGATWRQR